MNKVIATMAAATLMLLSYVVQTPAEEGVGAGAGGAANILVPARSFSDGMQNDEKGAVNVPAEPRYFNDTMKNEAIKDSRTTTRSYIPRHFVDFYFGSVTTADDDVSSSTQGDCFLFCGPYQYYGQKAHFEHSNTFGIRFGKWLDDYPAIGLAADFSYLTADAPGAPTPYRPWGGQGVSVWYTPISFEALARYQMLKTDAVPDGRAQVYGGLVLSEIVGDVKVNGVGGFSDGLNLGYGALAGIAWHFPRVALFAEYRMLRASLTYDSSDGMFGNMFGASKASVDLHTKQMVFGMSYKY